MAADADDIAAEIIASAIGPKKVTVDGMTTEQHPLPDLIAAERFQRAKESMRRGRTGLVFAKTQPPSAL